jgi:hypothetical protein
MQTSYIRNKFDIRCTKIVLTIGLLVLAVFSGMAQTTKWIRKNNPNYDNRRLTYGFLIGLHTTSYKIRYNNKFVGKNYDSLYSVEPSWSPGFSLGFLVNYKLGDFFDLRLTPKVAFDEFRLKYFQTSNPAAAREEIVESTMVEFPLLMKYKSERRGNTRMYMIGGIKPAIEASGKRGVKDVTGDLEVKGTNLSLDFGFGFDLYYPLFKFSPEIRFSKGIPNMLSNPGNNKYGEPLSRISTNMISVYFIFQ